MVREVGLTVSGGVGVTVSVTKTVIGGPLTGVTVIVPL
jgi:hypothetical protein